MGRESAVHAQVRGAYAEKARAEAGCGCGSGEEKRSDRGGREQRWYPADLLQEVPAEVADFSLGCGDPVTIAGLKPGERVLDLGSGGGLDCFLAARRVGEQGFVIGVDMTPEMVEKAEANRVALGFTNVAFRLGEIEDLPVESESIDVVLSNCVINLSPDKPKVFREAFRVLRAGGRISVSDIVAEGEFAVALRENPDLWAACVSGALSLDDYLGMMREAGFIEVEVIEREALQVEVPDVEGVPPLFRARVTARKPFGADGGAGDGPVDLSG